MSKAVGVLIVDEQQGLDPTFRATLEHMPALQTIGDADLTAPSDGEQVAFVVVDEHEPAACAATVASLKERQPTLHVLASLQVLGADEVRALLEAGVDAFIARTAVAREVSTAITALASGHGRLTGTATETETGEVTDSLGLTLSVRTVETHRLNLRRKTQTGRLKDLVTLARQLGLAPVVDTEPSRPGRRDDHSRH